MEIKVKIPNKEEDQVKFQLFLFNLNYRWLDSGQRIISIM